MTKVRIVLSVLSGEVQLGIVSFTEYKLSAFTSRLVRAFSARVNHPWPAMRLLRQGWFSRGWRPAVELVCRCVGLHHVGGDASAV